MSEALKSIVSFGFKTLALHKIDAFTQKQNESSKRLLEKNGFILMEKRKDEDNSDNLIFEIDNPTK